MASYNPAVKNATWRGAAILFDSDGAIVSNPTIAAGDFTVSTDFGAFSNLDTQPSVAPGGGVQVQVDLSADEMNGENVLVVWKDQAGDEHRADRRDLDRRQGGLPGRCGV